MPKPMYVWSGSAWVSVASEVESLAGFATQSYADNTPGMKLIVPSSVAVGSGSGSVATQGTVSFSGASSVSLNGCFNSTYDNYYIKFFISAVSANITPTMRLRSAGTDSSTNYVQGRIYQNSTTVAGQGSPYGTDEWGLLDTSSSYGGANCEMFLYSPFLASATVGNEISSGTDSGNNLYLNIYGLRHTTASSYDGLTVLASSGTMTGTINVYGYKKG